jgi:uncharacterized RDD family membrane protein YckC
LIDAVVFYVPWFVIYLISFAVHFLFLLDGLYGLAAGIFLAVQVGQSGSSPGMRVIGLKCVGQSTGQPLGAGMGVVRAIAHFIDSLICYIGWLFPLWDSNRQTIADKCVSSVVVVVPKQSFSLTPTA